jgi:hypothetical protein
LAYQPICLKSTFDSSIAVGDFNGDGRPDLVVSGGNVAVLLNNAHGTFRPGPILLTQVFAGPVVVGDFTGDGKQDIGVALTDTIEIFPGCPSSLSWILAPTSVKFCS